MIDQSICTTHGSALVEINEANEPPGCHLAYPNASTIEVRYNSNLAGITTKQDTSLICKYVPLLSGNPINPNDSLHGPASGGCNSSKCKAGECCCNYCRHICW